MSDIAEKVQKSIERIKAFEPRDGSGYYLAFSGGKDSVVCKALLDMAGELKEIRNTLRERNRREDS